MAKKKAMLIGAALLALSGVVHATNPCDFDEKACDAWNKYLAQQQAWQTERQARKMEYPPRYTGKYDDCPYGKELDGKAIQAAVTFRDTGKIVIVKLSPASCQMQYPREEPEGSPYTRRVFQSTDGTQAGIYSSPDRPTSTMSFYLPDGATSATLIPAFRTDDLASGKELDLGEVLLVRLDKNGQNGKVVPVRLMIRSVAP